MRIFSLANYFLSSPAWIMVSLIFTAFIIGLLPDIDHPIAYWLGIENGRFLHPYFNLAGYILLGCGIGFVVASFCRLSLSRFLRG